MFYKKTICHNRRSVPFLRRIIKRIFNSDSTPTPEHSEGVHAFSHNTFTKQPSKKVTHENRPHRYLRKRHRTHHWKKRPSRPHNTQHDQKEIRKRKTPTYFPQRLLRLHRIESRRSSELFKIDKARDTRYEVRGTKYEFCVGVGLSVNTSLTPRKGRMCGT